MCRWHVCIFVIESVQKLYFCVSVVCVFSACVFVGIRAASLCFIRPPGVQCSLAILKVRDDTVGEGSVITATSPSLHLCFHVFSSLSLFCGSWYVDFIKFSSEWVTEKTGGDEGSHPLFAAFIRLSSFIPARGLWSSGPRGEKVAQVPLPSLDTVLHNNSLIPLRSESGKEI